MEKRFKIRGPYSEDDRAHLYWSNALGWTSCREATVFNRGDFPSNHLPIEAIAIAWLDRKGHIYKVTSV